MIYLLMHCVSTHGIIQNLHIRGPECRPISAHHCLMGAVVAAVDECVSDKNSYEMTPDEIECRSHLWVQGISIK